MRCRNPAGSAQRHANPRSEPAATLLGRDAGIASEETAEVAKVGKATVCPFLSADTQVSGSNCDSSLCKVGPGRTVGLKATLRF